MPSIGLHTSACSQTPRTIALSSSLNFFILDLVTGPTETHIGSLCASTSFHAFELVPPLPSSYHIMEVHPLSKDYVPNVPPSNLWRAAPFFSPSEVVMNSFAKCTGANDDPAEVIPFNL